MEKWLPMPGYEGWYEVSSLGRARRVRTGKSTKIGRVLKLQTHADGYVFVEVCRDGVQKKYLISRLVCEAFKGPCPEGMNCNHISGKKSNNAAINLEWATHSDNCKHKYNVLGHSLKKFRDANPFLGLKGDKHPYSKEYVVTTPEGSDMRIKGLKDFCRKENLSFGAMVGMATGSSNSRHHKYWKCRKP